MKDLEQARLLLRMAQKDLKALRGMQNSSVFEEEVFGFHAQQALEKILKAWLALLGFEYPRTHDLSFLLQLLASKNVAVDRLLDIVEYNAYAVQLRYEAFDFTGEPLDRVQTVQRINDVMAEVEKLLEEG